jgi:hypothetical protein
MPDDKLGEIGYKLVAKPLYKLGEKLSGEKPEESVKRYNVAADKIESGKSIVHDSSWPRKRAAELSGHPMAGHPNPPAARKARDNKVHNDAGHHL